MKPYQEESLDREADPNGLLLQPTFGKAVGSSPYHQVEGNQHLVKSLAGGGTTEEEVREETRARVRKHRAAKKKAPKVSVTHPPVTESAKSKAGSPPPRPESEPRAPRATGSAEVSIEERREQMAQLDQPAEEILDEVDRRASCVANTIRRQVEGLIRMDAERFFAVLRDRIDDIEREAFDEAASHAAPGHSRRSQHSAVPARECGMSTTTPPFPTNRDRGLRKVKDSIAALDLAGRDEGGLSSKEANEQRDNLVQAVWLFEAR